MQRKKQNFEPRFRGRRDTIGSIIIENAKNTAIDTGVDQYIVGDLSRTPTAYCSRKKYKRTDWILGKVVLKYKDGCLNAEYVEYPNPIKIEMTYKGVDIIKVNLNGIANIYTIFKNKEVKNKNTTFFSVKEVKLYIDGFDKYAEEDRNWFLTKIDKE